MRKKSLVLFNLITWKFTYSFCQEDPDGYDKTLVIVVLCLIANNSCIINGIFSLGGFFINIQKDSFEGKMTDITRVIVLFVNLSLPAELIFFLQQHLLTVGFCFSSEGKKYATKMMTIIIQPSILNILNDRTGEIIFKLFAIVQKLIT